MLKSRSKEGHLYIVTTQKNTGPQREKIEKDMANAETRRRQAVCFALSVYALTIYAVYNSASTSVSFLQATVKLTTGFNVVILTVFSILNSAVLWKVSTSLLFGNLRLIEYEHIFERLPFTIINTVFMSSMFSEHDFFTVALFGLLLLYMKVFHWILRDRLEALLQSIHETTTLKALLCTRFSFNLLLLAFLDYQIVSRCVTNSLSNSFGASTSVHLMVGMEFAMLLIDLLNLAMHTSLNFYEFYKSQSDTNARVGEEGDEEEDEQVEDDGSSFAGLEGKFMYERAIDVFTRFLKTLIHLVMLIPFRMSFLLIKDVFWDVLTLCQNVTSLWKIWRNNKQLDDKLKTMSPVELASTDNVCIVCMDELCSHLDEAIHGPHRNNAASKGKYKPKRLPCGHVLHLFCLKNWMERSQTCPICRLPVFDENGNVVQSSASSGSSAGTATNGHTNSNSAESPTNTPSTTAAPSTVSSAALPPRSPAPTSSTPTATERKGIIPWYTYPIQDATNDTVNFSMMDSSMNKTITAKLTIADKGKNNLQDIQRVVVPGECIHHLESVEGLQRRINELETKVKELGERSVPN